MVHLLLYFVVMENKLFFILTMECLSFTETVLVYGYFNQVICHLVYKLGLMMMMMFYLFILGQSNWLIVINRIQNK